MTRSETITLAILAVAAILGTFAPFAAAQSAVTGVLQGPTALAPGATGAFFLNASGGPAPESNGNFSITYYITGPDLTGGLPTQAAARTETVNASGAFTLNVTAPQKEQVITLVVELNSTAGARSEKTTLSRAITVITPIVLTATFVNNGAAAAVNIPVKFFVDGKLVGKTNISRIDPGETGAATLSYLPVGLGPGAHGVRVEADLNQNGVVEPDKGEVVTLDVFYRKDWELSWGWAIVIMSATILVAFLAIRGLRRRQR